jgi:hypothetical protein
VKRVWEVLSWLRDYDPRSRIGLDDQGRLVIQGYKGHNMPLEPLAPADIESLEGLDEEDPKDVEIRKLRTELDDLKSRELHLWTYAGPQP